MDSIPVWKAIFLGAIQGLTEFLPISSSAHLVIFQNYLGLTQSGSFLMAFDIALHFGTLCAIVAAFQSELKWIFKEAHGRKIGLYLVLATIPAAVIGFFLKGFFETFFADMIPTSFFLIVTGWILWTTKKALRAQFDFAAMRPRHAWLIGLAQAVAIFPGISRSGATIAMALWLKLKPEVAVKFSFLLAILAIAGANLLEVKHFAALELRFLFPMLMGVLTAFGTGYVAIRWMLKLVSRQKLYQFAWYCWIFGGFIFVKELFF